MKQWNDLVEVSFKLVRENSLGGSLNMSLLLVAARRCLKHFGVTSYNMPQHNFEPRDLFSRTETQLIVVNHDLSLYREISSGYSTSLSQSIGDVWGVRSLNVL